MGGKTSTSSSSVSVPPEVLARYNAVNSIAEKAAGIQKTAQVDKEGNPVLDSSGNQQYDYSMGQYTPYGGEFVAPVNAQESASIQNINNSQWAAQPGLNYANDMVQQGLSAGTAGLGAALGTFGAAMPGMQQGYQNSLNTVANGAANAQNQFNNSLQTVEGGAQQGQGLYNQSLGSIGSAAGTANNQYGTIYGDINSAKDVGKNYADAANNAITGSTDVAAPLMQQGVNLTNQGLGAGAQYAQQSNDFLRAGTQNVNPTQFGQAAINQYMSPYINDVIKAQQGLMNQQNAQQSSAMKGDAIAHGAFGGDRADIAQANLAQQQGLANQATLSGILNQGYGQALGAFQQQQGVDLAAQQANRQAQQYGQQASAALGQQQYGQALGAGQNLANIGNTLYGQNLGQGQALAGLGQQQYGQGLGAAQAQAGLIGQNYQMGAQQAGLQQQAAQGLFGQSAQQAGLQQAAGTNLFNQSAQQAGLQQASAQNQFNNQAQQAQFQAQAAQNAFNMNQQAGMNTGNLALQRQQALLQGNQAALAGGQLMQQTQQAQDQAQYNQFLQQQGYPFQVAQYLANIAEGTGALSGSTTTTTQPAPFLSDRRLKEDIRRIGETDDGMPIYKYRYKGDKSEQTHIGFMADEVEEKKPDAVGEYKGYKTVDYDRATRASGGGIDEERGTGPAGPYGGALRKGIGSTGYIPSANLTVRQLMLAKPVGDKPSSGLQQVQQTMDAGKTIQQLYGMGKSAKSYLEDLGKDKEEKARGGGLGYAGGGGVEDVEPYGDEKEAEGYMHGVLKSMKEPRALATAQNPTGAKGGSGLSDVMGLANAAKSIYGMGSSAASGIGSLFGAGASAGADLGAATAAGMAADAGAAAAGSSIMDFLPFLLLKNGGAVDRKARADGGPLEGEDPAPEDSSYDINAIPDNVMALLSPDQAKAVVSNAAKKAGINPNDLHGIAHEESRHRNILGDDGSSAGILQMHVGNLSKKYPRPGLGDDAVNALIPDQAKSMSPRQKIEWLNADENQQRVADYAAMRAKQDGYGAWSTAKKLGLVGGRRNAGAAEPKGGLSSAMGTADDLANRFVSSSPGAGPQQKQEGLGGLLKSEKFWIPLLSGLGTMASSNSRYLGSAVLQGLGGAANSYANLQKQQSELENQQAHTQQTYAQTARDNYNPNSKMVLVKDPTTGKFQQMLLGEYLDKYGNLPPDQRPTLELRTPANIPQKEKEGPVQPEAPIKLPGATDPTAPTTSTPAGTQPAPNAPAPGQTPASPGAATTPPAVPPPVASGPFAPTPEELAEGHKWVMTRANYGSANKEPDFYTDQSIIARDAGKTQQLIVPLAKELASVPRTGLLAPGPVQEFAKPIAGYLNNLGTILGKPGMFTTENVQDANARQEVIDKLSTQLQGQQTSAAQQHALAALQTFGKGIPGNINQPKAMAEMIAQIMTNNQRETDRNNYFENYRKSVTGGQNRLQDVASESGRLANDNFEKRFSNDYYQKERESLAKMFGNAPQDNIVVKQPDGSTRNVPIMAYLASNPQLSPKARAQLSEKYGPNILRYFGIQ